MVYDVAIVGGGPSGTTTAGFLKKYNPQLSVGIFEREKFPRDHVGESQLPPISRILHELDVWDKVESANFPIKIGASYRWGKNPEIWDFEFISRSQFRNEARPARFEGQRKWTAFQVDRAIYDAILMEHARELGAEVHERCRVNRVVASGDRVEALLLDSGEEVTARHYIDATGHSGLIRRAMGVETETPTSLQNVAIWDYWQNAEWAEEIGVGGTMVQVLSLGYGWFWFIPLGPTRTSIGFVTSADYLRGCGLTPRELYDRALKEESKLQLLIKNALPEGRLQTTKDWSFIANRLTGANWMLVGESAGFADPILAAGMTLAHASAREAAFTVLELELGQEDPGWLKHQYEKLQVRRIGNHIRFADYWYTANAQFTDLKEFTSKIATENGLDLSPDKAWAWLAQGGFIDEEFTIGVAGFSLDQVKELGSRLSELAPSETLSHSNVFHANTKGAEKLDRAIYSLGRVKRSPCLSREGRFLPIQGATDLILFLLSTNSTRKQLVEGLLEVAARYSTNETFVSQILAPFEVALEAMIYDGWIDASFEPGGEMSTLPNNHNVIEWLGSHSLPVPVSFQPLLAGQR